MKFIPFIVILCSCMKQGIMNSSKCANVSIYTCYYNENMHLDSIRLLWPQDGSKNATLCDSQLLRVQVYKPAVKTYCNPTHYELDSVVISPIKN